MVEALWNDSVAMRAAGLETRGILELSAQRGGA